MPSSDQEMSKPGPLCASKSGNGAIIRLRDVQARSIMCKQIRQWCHHQTKRCPSQVHYVQANQAMMPSSDQEMSKPGPLCASKSGNDAIIRPRDIQARSIMCKQIRQWCHHQTKRCPSQVHYVQANQAMMPSSDQEMSKPGPICASKSGNDAIIRPRDVQARSILI